MALETVTVFEIEALLLPACVTPSASLNLRFFSAKNGNDLYDKVGVQEVVAYFSLLPCLFISLWLS